MHLSSRAAAHLVFPKSVRPAAAAAATAAVAAIAATPAPAPTAPTAIAANAATAATATTAATTATTGATATGKLDVEPHEHSFDAALRHVVAELLGLDDEQPS